MIKNIIIAIIVLGLGVLFFLQKQHEKKEAIELKKRQEQAFIKAHAKPSPTASSLKGPTRPTPMLAPAGTLKPKPTPMLPKPTPMLRPSPPPS
jgi:cell division protein FtsN